MRHLYWALSEVTRFGRPDITNADRPAGWRAWIAGVALYFKQVLYGKYMRMALILKLLKEAGTI